MSTTVPLIESLTTTLANVVAVAAGLTGAVMGTVSYVKSRVVERRLLYEPGFKKRWPDVLRQVSQGVTDAESWLGSFDYYWHNKDWYHTEKYDRTRAINQLEVSQASLSQAGATLGDEYDKKLFRDIQSAGHVLAQLIAAADDFNETTTTHSDLRFGVGLYWSAASRKDRQGVATMYKEQLDERLRTLNWRQRWSLSWKRFRARNRAIKLAKTLARVRSKVKFYERTVVVEQ